jgi:hypothetical protein
MGAENRWSPLEATHHEIPEMPLYRPSTPLLRYASGALRWYTNVVIGTR